MIRKHISHISVISEDISPRTSASASFLSRVSDQNLPQYRNMYIDSLLAQIRVSSDPSCCQVFSSEMSFRLFLRASRVLSVEVPHTSFDYKLQSLKGFEYLFMILCILKGHGDLAFGFKTKAWPTWTRMCRLSGSFLLRENFHELHVTVSSNLSLTTAGPALTLCNVFH